MHGRGRLAMEDVSCFSCDYLPNALKSCHFSFKCLMTNSTLFRKCKCTFKQIQLFWHSFFIITVTAKEMRLLKRLVKESENDQKLSVILCVRWGGGVLGIRCVIIWVCIQQSRHLLSIKKVPDNIRSACVSLLKLVLGYILLPIVVRTYLYADFKNTLGCKLPPPTHTHTHTNHLLNGMGKCLFIYETQPFHCQHLYKVASMTCLEL